MPERTLPAIRWLRLGAGILLILLVVLSAFVIIAHRAYYQSHAAALPCRECTGEAQAVHINGFDLYYREIGTDRGQPPVIILHGGPGHSSAGFKQSLDFLAQNRRVIYYDQRGSGYSEIKSDPSLYTIDQLVEELEALRRDVVGAERIILIGHSAGGALAQRYALAYGDHVEKLVLVSSIPINNGVGAPVLWDVFGPALFILGAGFPPADPEAANEWFRPLMIDTSVPRLYDRANRALLEDSGYISFATWREVSRSLGGEDFRDRLGQLQTETLVIYGVADSNFTGEEVAADLCGLLPHCRLARFEKSGHWPFLEEPVQFAEVLNDFLGDK